MYLDHIRHKVEVQFSSEREKYVVLGMGAISISLANESAASAMRECRPVQFLVLSSSSGDDLEPPANG